MKYRHRLICIVIALVTLLTGCTAFTVARLNMTETLQTAVDDDKLYLMGTINAKSFDTVSQVLDTHPSIQTIVFTANPGSVDDETNLKLGKCIRSRGLNTHLTHQSVIASGAVDLFLSGVERTIEKGARLGVHSWDDGFEEATDFSRNDPAHKPYTDYTKQMIGSDAFYWFTITEAPADSIHWMTDREITHYRIATSSLKPPANDPTPFGEDFLEERQLVLED